MCVRMLLCVSVLRQCQSSLCYHGGTEGCISGASHRMTAATAVSLIFSITSNTCRMNLTQAVLQCPSLSPRRVDNSGRTPAAPSLTYAMHEHSERQPCVCLIHTFLRLPAEEVENEWITPTFLSKQSKPGDCCFVSCEL